MQNHPDVCHIGIYHRDNQNISLYPAMSGFKHDGTTDAPHKNPRIEIMCDDQGNILGANFEPVRDRVTKKKNYTDSLHIPYDQLSDYLDAGIPRRLYFVPLNSDETIDKVRSDPHAYNAIRNSSERLKVNAPSHKMLLHLNGVSDDKEYNYYGFSYIPGPDKFVPISGRLNTHRVNDNGDIDPNGTHLGKVSPGAKVPVHYTDKDNRSSNPMNHIRDALDKVKLSSSPPTYQRPK